MKEKSQVVKCPECDDLVNSDEMTTYEAKRMCEGCACHSDEHKPENDPLGKGWTNNNSYGYAP